MHNNKILKNYIIISFEHYFVSIGNNRYLKTFSDIIAFVNEMIIELFLKSLQEF